MRVLVRLAACALVGSALVLGGCAHQRAVAPIAAPAKRDFVHVGAPAPPLALVDDRGRPYALARDGSHATVLFFGYAHCADVCPATLASLARARALLPERLRERTQVAFVTVDPHRDSPATLRAYLARFDPSFVGLTGDDDALRRVDSDYGVFHQVVPPRRMGGAYLVAHEGLLWFVDAHGIARASADWRESPRAFARRMSANARA